MESLTRRKLHLAGLAMIVLSLFLPIHGCRAEPKDFEPLPPGVLYDYGGWRSPLLVPVQSIPDDIARGGLWEARHWYPYFLVPLWILLLLGVARGDSTRRWRLGVLAMAVSVLIALFEAAYLWTNLGTGLDSVGPHWMRPLEVLGVWVVVLFVLFHRRPGHRRVEDVQATVSSQALLGALHALSFPAWDFARPILNGHGPWPAFASASCNYRYGLWVAVLGLLLLARPGYTSRAVAVDEHESRLLSWTPFPKGMSLRRARTMTGTEG